MIFRLSMYRGQPCSWLWHSQDEWRRYVLVYKTHGEHAQLSRRIQVEAAKIEDTHRCRFPSKPSVPTFALIALLVR